MVKFSCMNKIKNSLSPKSVAIAYALVSVILFIYIFVRAVTVDFTHDESLSWQILQGDEIQLITANNHWLNTALMYIFSSVAGYSEIVLRLPNVLAFAFYLLFIYKIYKHFSGYAPALLFAVPVLLLNPFLLDFFSLARGYGLAMAFFTGAIYYSMRFYLQENRLKYILLACLISILTIYANFSFLTAVFSVHIAAVILMFFRRDRIKTAFICYVLEAAALIPAALCILRLKETDALYFGGNEGVVRDTLRTVTISSLNAGHDFVQPVMILCGILFLLMFFVRRKQGLLYLKILVPVTLILPVICFYLLDMPFALNRAGLYWVVIMGLCILVSLEKKGGSLYGKVLFYSQVSALVILSGLVSFNFIKCVNISYATSGNLMRATVRRLHELQNRTLIKSPLL